MLSHKNLIEVYLAKLFKRPRDRGRVKKIKMFMRMRFNSVPEDLQSMKIMGPFILKIVTYYLQQQIRSKGDRSWMFFGRNDAKAETPVLWPPHVKSWLIGKDPDAGRDWRQEQKGKTEDEMAGWHHRLNGHEFKWTPGVDDGQGGLVCCNSWGHKESDTTEQLNWTELIVPSNAN